MPPVDPVLEELKDRFEVLEVLGSGAMGSVVRARERSLGREVALKVQRVQSAGHAARLQREAQTMAMVRHRALPEIYEMGTTPAGPWISMELLPGRSLDQVRPGEVDALEVMLEVAGGLEAVHRAGLLHRDVKPANIMVTEDGRAVLTDFGLALDLDRTRLTATGLVGTPLFLAPEVIRGAAATAAADWYAWGVTLFWVDEGRPPFSRDRMMALLTSSGTGDWPGPEFSRIRPGSARARLITACMAEDPADRPRSVADLEQLQQERDLTASVASVALPTPASSAAPSRPWTRPALAAAVALVLGVLGLRALAPRPAAPGAAPPVTGPEAPAPSAASAGPWAPDLAHVEAVRAEVEAARALFLDRDGRVVRAAVAAEEDRPLLDDDPLFWGPALRALPATHRAWRWLVEGGRPEDLSPEGREALEEIDEVLGRAGLAAPFRIVRDLDERDQPYTHPAGVEVGELHLREDLALEGWGAVAGRAFRRALEAKDRLEADHATAPDGPSGRSGALAIGRVLGVAEVKDYLAGLPPTPETRRRVSIWVEEGSQPLRRGMYAAARSIEEDPAGRDRRALFFCRAVAHLDAFFHGPVRSLGVEEILGLRPRHAWTWMLAAEAFREVIQADPSAGAGYEDPEALDALVMALRRAMQQMDTGDAWWHIRRMRGFDRLLEAYTRGGRNELARDLVAEMRPLVEEPRRVPPDVLVKLAGFASVPRSEVPSEDRARILAAMEVYRQRGVVKVKGFEAVRQALARSL